MPIMSLGHLDPDSKKLAVGGASGLPIKALIEAELIKDKQRITDVKMK